MSIIKRKKFRSKKSRLLCIVLSLALITAIPLSAPLTASAIPPEVTGSGTQSAPYIITTAAQLADLAVEVNNPANPNSYAGKYFKLANDIDLSAYGAGYNGGKGWIPIGVDNTSELSPFSGNFDGGGHTISNLYTNYDNLNNIGLFGIVEGGSISNLRLEEVDVTGRNLVGGLVGAAYDEEILKCFVKSGSVVARDISSGLVGDFQKSTVVNCYTSCSVKSTSTNGGAIAAGIVGRLSGGIIKSSYSTGDIYSNTLGGGIAGYMTEEFNSHSMAIIDNCYATGAVIAQGGLIVGGIAGFISYETSITACAALNKKLEGGNSSAALIGRIAGSHRTSGIGPYAENVALAGMDCDPSPALSDANMNITEISADDAFNNNVLDQKFKESDGWVHNPGKLPTFELDTEQITPEIVSVKHTSTDGGLNGVIKITFNQAMTADGIVTLTSSPFGKAYIDLGSGTWDSTKHIYTINFRGLAYATEYTVNISDFEGTATAKAAKNSSYRFNTLPVPKKTTTVTGPGKQQTGGTQNVSSAKIFLGGINVALARGVPYTGKAVNPPVKVVFDGKALQQGKDYALSFANNIKIGKAKVTVVGAGAYKGAKTVTFKILPTKLKIKKLSVSKKNKGLMRVHWKAAPKSQKITKYQVRYRIKGTKKWKFKTLKAKAKSLTLKKLKGKKRYQVQLRSYKIVGKIKYYSPWSKTKLSKRIKK